MAISDSGSIALSQIQAEWGGSNPISLSEYYSGSLSNAVNQSTISEYPAIGAHYVTVSTPATKLTNAYTTTYANNGWADSNIRNTTTAPALAASSQTYTRTINADNAGNAGTIPSSGAIQFDHFRSTAKGSTSSITCYGWYSQQFSGGISGAAVNGTLYVWLAGHQGGASEAANNWTGVPFRYIVTTAEGSGAQMPITTWYGSDTNSNNGANGGQNYKYHSTVSNLGNITQYSWNLNSSSFFRNFSGTVTMNFTF